MCTWNHVHVLQPSTDCLCWVPQIQKDFNRNKYFNPQEALDYGLIDNVLRPPRSQSLGVA